MKRLLHNLWTQFWLTGVVCLVLLALYTSLGRQLIPLVETLKYDVEQVLSAQLGTPVTLDTLQGDWIWFSPRIKVNKLSIGDKEKIIVQRLEAELNVSASLFYRVPVFESITLAGVHLPFSEDHNNNWRLGHFSLVQNENNNTPATSFLPAEKPLWLELLSQQGEIHLFNWQVDIARFDKPLKTMKLLDLRLRNNGLQHWLDGEIQLAETGAVLTTKFEVEGDLWDFSDHNGKGYLELTTQAWQDWIPDKDNEWQVNELTAGAKLWLEVEEGLLHRLDGYLDIPQFSVVKTEKDNAKELSFEQGRITLAGRRDTTDWHLWFESDLQWLNEIAPPNPKGRLSWLPSIEGGWQLALDDIDLVKTARWIEHFQFLAPVYMEYITNLKPRGNVDQVRVNLIPEQDWLWGVNLELSNGKIDAWNGIPAAGQINASIALNAKQGHLRINNSDTYIHFDQLYKDGWVLENVDADIFWQIEPDYLRLAAPNIVAGYQQAQVNGGFSFYTPLKDGSIEPQLNLLLGIKHLDLLKQNVFVPFTVADDISSWLNSNIKGGLAKQGSFLYAGSVADEIAEQAQTIQLYADVQNAQVTYLPAWPEVENVKANVMVDVPNVDIWMHRGRTLGGNLVPSSGRLKVRSDENNTWMTLRGQLQGSAQEGIKYLQDTPLRDQVGGAFDTWKVANGNIVSELYAQIPLTDKGNNKIRLTSQLDKVDVIVEDLDLSFQNINGEVTFDSDLGLSSLDLSANTFSGLLKGVISSEKVGDGFDIKIDAQGQAQATAIKQWLPLFMFETVSGELDYQGSLFIRPIARGGLEMSMSSDLKGIQIATPAPFGKVSEQVLPFQLNVTKTRDVRINFSYSDLANGVMAMEKGRLKSGQIYLGTTPAYLPSDDGLTISGNINHELDAKAWWDLWNEIKPKPDTNVEAEGDKAAILTHINISAPAVNAWEIPMGPSHIEGNHKWGQWQFDLESELVKGKIIMPDDLENNAINMDLEYIHMPITENDPNKDIKFGARETVDPLESFDPKWIPSTDMKVEEVFLGTSNYGRWDMTMRQQDEFTQIHINDSLSKSMTMKGDINWSKDENGHKTHLSLFRLTSKNLGDSQRAFRKAASIEAEKSRFDVDLHWQGSPARFNYGSLNGFAKVNIKEGVLVSDNAGALKAFGVLNFNSISRRLQLDFSDLYEEGVVFDVLKTRLSFEDGIATLVDPLWIDGPSAKFQSSGLINFNTEEIDQKLVVTFPITSSLPLVAVLAGLAPQIAGAIYVTEKLIGEELEQFTSASYTVSGTIENPKMEIDQAFDNELEGKESRSFKDRFLDIFGLGSDDE